MTPPPDTPAGARLSDRRIGHLRDDDPAPTVESLQRAVKWRDEALAAVQRERDALAARLAAHDAPGLAEAVEAELDACRCTQQWSGFDKIPFTNRLNCPAHGDDHTGMRRRLRALLAAHPPTAPEPSVVEEEGLPDYRSAFLKANEACSVRETEIIDLQARVARAEQQIAEALALADGWYPGDPGARRMTSWGQLAKEKCARELRAVLDQPRTQGGPR